MGMSSYRRSWRRSGLGPREDVDWTSNGGTLMKIQRFLIVLTLVNLALLIFTLAAMRQAAVASSDDTPWRFSTELGSAPEH